MIENLLNELIKSDKRVFIQTHDFPDPDAVASAYGLQYFFSLFNIKSYIVYSGEIQRDSLRNMIKTLKIEITKGKDSDVTPEDLIVIVDGCKGSKNVTDLPGFEIAVIDHHIVEQPEDVPFVEISEELGSCSTIITGYYMKKGIDIPENIATALKIGLSRDTDLLTRKVTDRDVDAYHYLHSFADNNMVNNLLRNNIQLSDFEFFSTTITQLKRERSVAWHYFDQGCETNLMGILGDFILSAQEIKLSILIANNEDRVAISIRNGNPDWSAAECIRLITKGIGAGGGHNEMAGGIIFSSKDFSEEKTIQQVLKHLYAWKNNPLPTYFCTNSSNTNFHEARNISTNTIKVKT